MGGALSRGAPGAEGGLHGPRSVRSQQGTDGGGVSASSFVDSTMIWTDGTMTAAATSTEIANTRWCHHGADAVGVAIGDGAAAVDDAIAVRGESSALVGSWGIEERR